MKLARTTVVLVATLALAGTVAPASAGVPNRFPGPRTCPQVIDGGVARHLCSKPVTKRFPAPRRCPLVVENGVVKHRCSPPTQTRMGR